MSTTDNEIIRLTNARNTIRTKLVELKLANDTDKIDTLATTIDNITNQGAVQAQIKEGETFTIPKGYHNGAGTVRGIAGGGDYALQSKEGITPTKSQQEITPDTGYYGLSGVTINPIPNNYADISSVEVVQSDVLANKKFVDHNGNLTVGTMTNYSGNNVYSGIVNPYWDGLPSAQGGYHTMSYDIPEGYHNGSAFTIKVDTETVVTPTEEEQFIEPSEGCVLSSVVIEPIPTTYGYIADVTATAKTVLKDREFVDNTGTTVFGTMPDYSGVSAYKYQISPYYHEEDRIVTIPEGYHKGSQITIIMEDEITVTPTKEEQFIEPEVGQVLTTVFVEPIPDEYIDTRDADADASMIYDGATAYVNGVKVTGTMEDHTGFGATLSAQNTSVNLEEGYYREATINIIPEVKSVTPTTSTQTIVPTAGQVLSKVTVAAIPDTYVLESDIANELAKI